jgi:hypothetical protein
MRLRGGSSCHTIGLALAFLVLQPGCGGTAPEPLPSPSPPPPDPILVAAGDIASCTSDGAEATARLLDAFFPPDAPPERGVVAALGDNAYPRGSLGDYTACYEPTWGRHRARTRPAPGNHEYLTPGAEGYFDYFGSAAGDPARGYYSYDIGAWHVAVLNSNCDAVGGCEAGSTQETWLRDDLARHPSPCALAYWHHPLFSSGVIHGGDSVVRDLWLALQDHGVELVLAGHEHNYERFAPQDADGQPDAARGVREFVVGTGGNDVLYGFGPTDPDSEVRENDSYGVLELTLHPRGYNWRFLPAAGATFTDEGSEVCH